MALEVRCPNCGTDFVLGNGDSVSTTNIKNGIAYLVPRTIRNENCGGNVNDRMKAFKDAGIDISKLQSLMQTDANIKEIFSDPNDKVLEEIGKGGFIRNPELFRRWITAQSFALLKDPRGWTHAVRKHYNTHYVFRQTKQELELQIKLHKKGINNDKRYTFFTLEDMKRIFADLVDYNQYFSDSGTKRVQKSNISVAESMESLLRKVNNIAWYFSCKQTFLPRTWLNCFKGAGAYYTLQNIIRTHGMILPNCKDMNESLERVEDVYKNIIDYEPYHRRWDILLSVLTVAVKETKFELKY